ncbi:hypothetical protein V5799_031575 [Amblyomma americanum]|uniref:Uncharacterized protein n=1 Tax=Amblyomma americanum TaxID=6943 RepID=A0AAQ4DTM9_AMBAM
MGTRFEDLREELKKEMKKFQSKVERDLRKELREIKESHQFFNNNFEDAKAKNEAPEKENVALKKENEALRNVYDNIKKQLDEHGLRLVAGEQYSRTCNVEIKGILQEQNDDVTSTVYKVATFLDMTITPDEIDFCQSEGSQ